MLDKITTTKIICDVCQKPISLDRYWEITAKDAKVWHAHNNCGLYLQLSLPFFRKNGLSTEFNFLEKSQYQCHD